MIHPKHIGNKRETIIVRLADGTKIRIRNKAKRAKVGFSEMVRRLILMGLGI